MRLSVDSIWSDEVKQLSKKTEWFGNNFAFIGGAPLDRLYIPKHTHQFFGCIKKVNLYLIIKN